jgi:hypothetical protein
MIDSSPSPAVHDGSRAICDGVESRLDSDGRYRGERKPRNTPPGRLNEPIAHWPGRNSQPAVDVEKNVGVYE